MNLASCGRDNWSGNEDDLKKIDFFHHESIRIILGIRMSAVKEEKITNEEVRRRFGEINSITVWKERILLFVRRIVRLKKDRCAPTLLTASADGKKM